MKTNLFPRKRNALRVFKDLIVTLFVCHGCHFSDKPHINTTKTLELTVSDTVSQIRQLISEGNTGEALQKLTKDGNNEAFLLKARFYELQRNNQLHTVNIVQQVYEPFLPNQSSRFTCNRVA